LCAQQSQQSLPTFKTHEFNSLYHMDGGTVAWEKVGLPVTK
jgi:rhodanese-related sulfurtransferase